MKKQITIDGENSDWYEKAVFILKDKEPSYIPDNLFLYAENIVENHLKKNPITFSHKKNEKLRKQKKEDRCTAQIIDRFFDISLIICGLSIIVVIVLMYT